MAEAKTTKEKPKSKAKTVKAVKESALSLCELNRQSREARAKRNAEAQKA